MLDAIGVGSVDELFEDIPEELRLGRPLELPDGMAETEVYDRLTGLAGRNTDAESEVSFLGAGMYDHYVPAIVDAITSRSEFLTPYTPYQPEISQGGLQAMFEFQTAMSELTGLPVSNAALYEGPSAVASAAYLAIGATGRTQAGGIARAASPQPRDAGHLLGGLRLPGGRGGPGGRRDGRRGAGRGGRRGDRRGLPPAAELPGLGRGRRGAGGGGEGEGRAGGRRLRPDRALDPEAAGRVRRRHRRRRGPAARQPARLRRPLVRVLLRDRGAHAPDAGQDRRRGHRRRRPPRVRADAADARAAHPPREGDAQHLHRPGAERAGGDGPPDLAGQARLRRAGRAAGAAHRLRPRAPGGRGRGRAAARGAGRARVRDPDLGGRAWPTWSGCSSDCAARGHRRRLPARPRLPRARGLPAGGAHRAPQQGGHRPARRGPRPARLRRPVPPSPSPRAWRREPDHRRRLAAPDLRQGGDADAARPRSHDLRALGAGAAAPRRCPPPASRSRRWRS